MATKWRVHRRREKERLCCKDAPSAVDAEGIFAFDMSRGEESRKPGMFAIARTRSRRAQLPVDRGTRRSTRPSERW